MSLISVNEQVRIVRGEHAGVVGWVQSIHVEPTNDLMTLVLLRVELARPYGHVIDALPSMVELMPHALSRAA